MWIWLDMVCFNFVRNYQAFFQRGCTTLQRKHLKKIRVFFFYQLCREFEMREFKYRTPGVLYLYFWDEGVQIQDTKWLSYEHTAIRGRKIEFYYKVLLFLCPFNFSFLFVSFKFVCLATSNGVQSLLQTLHWESLLVMLKGLDI